MSEVSDSTRGAGPVCPTCLKYCHEGPCLPGAVAEAQATRLRHCSDCLYELVCPVCNGLHSLVARQQLEITSLRDSFIDVMGQNVTMEADRDQALEKLLLLREAIEGLSRHDLRWKCIRFQNDDASPRRNCSNTGSDPCEVCLVFILLDQKEGEPS